MKLDVYIKILYFMIALTRQGVKFFYKNYLAEVIFHRVYSTKKNL